MRALLKELREVFRWWQALVVALPLAVLGVLHYVSVVKHVSIWIWVAVGFATLWALTLVQLGRVVAERDRALAATQENPHLAAIRARLAECADDIDALAGQAESEGGSFGETVHVVAMHYSVITGRMARLLEPYFKEGVADPELWNSPQGDDVPGLAVELRARARRVCELEIDG